MTTIHLQSLGEIPAIPAQDLIPGQKLAWNYSYGEYEVVSIESVSNQFLKLTERNIKTGETYSRKLKKTRLVGIAK